MVSICRQVCRIGIAGVWLATMGLTTTNSHQRGGVRGRSGQGRGDRGATAIEYALMVSLIAIVTIGGITIFGQNIIQLFDVPSSAL